MEKIVEVNGVKYIVKKVGTLSQSATVRIKNGVVLIKIPTSWPREVGFQTFMELEKKAFKQLAKNPEHLQALKSTEFFNGQEVTILGKPFKILVQEGNAKSSSAKLVGEVVEVAVASGIDESTQKQHVSNLARRVISHALLPTVQGRVSELNAKYFQFEFNKVFIKEQFSKWGSCSQNRNINLNFKLFFSPQEVFDYVIIHELSHLKEQNHGEAFWNLVTSGAPNYKESRKWLKENGAKLGIKGEA